METKVIREKLHQLIDEMDGKKAETVYSFLMREFEKDSFRKQLVRYEREKFLQGEGVSFFQLGGNQANSRKWLIGLTSKNLSK